MPPAVPAFSWLPPLPNHLAPFHVRLLWPCRALYDWGIANLVRVLGPSVTLGLGSGLARVGRRTALWSPLRWLCLEPPLRAVAEEAEELREMCRKSRLQIRSAGCPASGPGVRSAAHNPLRRPGQKPELLRACAAQAELAVAQPGEQAFARVCHFSSQAKPRNPQLP